VSAQHIGREFACRKCGAALVVRDTGLQLAAAATVPVGQGGFPPMDEPAASPPAEEDAATVVSTRRSAAGKRRSSGGGDITIFAIAAGAWAVGGLVTVVLTVLKPPYGMAAAGVTFLLGGPLLVAVLYQLMTAVQNVQQAVAELKSGNQKE
jgi:hypothetical protein